MIISASRRTDIPAFYSEWFLSRLRKGYALTRNPFNHSQVSKIPLSPDAVDCIVFWTKDPLSLLPRLDEIERIGYKYGFQFTLTPYGRELEPGLRNKAEIAATFRELSQKIGCGRINWRYDPIIFNDEMDTAWHAERFNALCGELAGYTSSVTVSFVDMYAKIKSPQVQRPSEDAQAALAEALGRIAREHGLVISTCCEAADFSGFGILRRGCISSGFVAAITGSDTSLPRDKNQRDGCFCVQSVDIGMYNTCQNGCVYCYANRSAKSAAKNAAEHDTAGELLVGAPRGGDIIKERKIHVG